MKASSSVAAILVAGVLIGAAVGWIGYFKLSKTRAIFILNVGEISLTNSFVEDPEALIERMKSPTFAAAVSERAKLPELATLLPSSQYGGRGQLTARALKPVSPGSPSLIEVTILSPSSQDAEAAATAVSQEILEDHAKRLAPFLEEMKRRATELRGAANSAPETEGSFLGRSPARPTDPGRQSGQDSIDKRPAKLSSGYDAAVALLTQQDKQTTLLFAPVVTKPGRTWMIAAPLGGVFVGIVFVFFALRIRRESGLRASFEDDASSPPT